MRADIKDMEETKNGNTRAEGVEQWGEIAARAQYYNNKILASVVYFAEPIKTGL